MTKVYECDECGRTSPEGENWYHLIRTPFQDAGFKNYSGPSGGDFCTLTCLSKHLDLLTGLLTGKEKK